MVLGLLAAVLVGFSTASYLAARSYLDHRTRERLDGALAVLAVSVEVHPDSVEWEGSDRSLPIGDANGPDRLLWSIVDHEGKRVDQSREPVPAEVMAAPDDDSRRLDRRGVPWRVARRRIEPSGTTSPEPTPIAAADASKPLHQSLDLTAAVSLATSDATLARLGFDLISLDVALWISAALLCRWLARRALAPLSSLVESARGLDATDPGWSLEGVSTGDELDALRLAFNDLLGRLHVAYDRQRRFGGEASHQLRTPLTILIGQVEVALRKDRSPDEYRRVLGAVLGRATQLGRIMEALLFLAKAETDSVAPTGELVDLHVWTAEFLTNRPSEPRSAGIRCEPASDDALPIRIHPPLLGQLLENLVDNALKYSPAGSAISIATRREEYRAVLSVTNAGPSLAEVDRAFLFEPFFRTVDARRRGIPGAGLGLSVVRRIADAFGGSARLSTDEPGTIRIEIRFPLAEIVDGSESAGSTLAEGRAIPYPKP